MYISLQLQQHKIDMLTMNANILFKNFEIALLLASAIKKTIFEHRTGKKL